MLRASDFPPNRKNQTAQAFRKFRDERRPPAARADPRVGAHDDGARVPRPSPQRSGLRRNGSRTPSCCRSLVSIMQLLRLDLLGSAVRSAHVANGKATAPERQMARATARRSPCAGDASATPTGPASGDSSIEAGSRRTERRPANEDDAAAVRHPRRERQLRRQHPRRRARTAARPPCHAEQERAEAPRGVARRLRLG